MMKANDVKIFIGEREVTGLDGRSIHESCKHVWMPHTIKEGEVERIVKICRRCHKIEDIIKGIK